MMRMERNGTQRDGIVTNGNSGEGEDGQSKIELIKD